MKIALMQPYYFPYLGYFDLIASAETFVFYDDADFSKNSWYNRNRILSLNKEWEYIRIAVQNSPLGTPVRDVRLKDKAADLARTNGLLQAYKRAPFYAQIRDLVNESFDASDESLSSIAVDSVKRVAAYLGLETNFILSSDVDYARDEDSVHKVLSVCKAFGADRYINLPGGQSLYRSEVFLSQGIVLSFTPPIDFRYQVQNFEFVPNLSIVDVLMWCSSSEVRSYLNSRVV